MKSIKRILVTVVATIVASIPVIMSSDAVKNYINDRPILAAYIPLVTGIVIAIDQSIKDRNKENKANKEVK